MPHPYKRAERVGQAMQEELGLLLLRDLKDPRIGRLTVTRVQVTDDLKSVRVSVAMPGDAAVRQRALEGLRSAAGFVRGELARRLNLRYAPVVKFEADDSLDALQRLGELFHRVEGPAAARDGEAGEDEA
jgi:ribosome-binding factor A